MATPLRRDSKDGGAHRGIRSRYPDRVGSRSLLRCTDQKLTRARRPDVDLGQRPSHQRLVHGRIASSEPVGVAVNQNLYFGKDPTQRRNCHYLVLFDNPVDRQPVATLGRQMYPSQRHLLMQTFREATRRPFGYLLRRLGGGEDDAEAEDEDVDSTGSESNTMEFEEEDVGSESDLMACRACGLVFAHARGLEIHQERDCGEEPSAKRCRTEDDGVEGTYGYELECYLEDLPATVCCADELPDEVSNRPRSFVVNTDDCDGKGIHWVAFHFPARGTRRIFRFTSDVLRSITFVASGTCSSPMDLNTDSVRLKCNRDHPIRADSIVYIS
ncbi:Hypothetical predicted protein [Mytilus galloprovincialis]|uniref:C2H2-type domain-containing protein n=1 Tax=Mytilus galloprovincialis TaxID=29158 RepID=A0A8B6DZ92_MYTGA|nr:Hypothetical predicted protein [Mytilus galloprovincialis]